MSKREEKLKMIFANHPTKKTVFMTSDDRAFFEEHHADAHGQTLPDKDVKTYTQAGLLAVEAIRSKIEAKRDAAVGGPVLKQVQDDGELTLPAAGVTEATDEAALIAKAEKIAAAKLNAEIEAEKSDNPGKEAEEKAIEEGAGEKTEDGRPETEETAEEKEAQKAEKVAAEKAEKEPVKKAEKATKAKETKTTTKNSK